MSLRSPSGVSWWALPVAWWFGRVFTLLPLGDSRVWNSANATSAQPASTLSHPT